MRSKSTDNQEIKFLLKELKKEWGKSREVKQEIVVARSEIKQIYNTLGRIILKRERELKQLELSFEDTIRTVRENYILLRLLKKIKKQEQKMEKGGSMETAFKTGLDKEEVNVFFTHCRRE